MIRTWLNCQMRNPSRYSFEVVEAKELLEPDEEILNYLAHELILAHACPEMVRAEYQLLVQDIEDVGLLVLKQFIEDEI